MLRVTFTVELINGNEINSSKKVCSVSEHNIAKTDALLNAIDKLIYEHDLTYNYGEQSQTTIYINN